LPSWSDDFERQKNALEQLASEVEYGLAALADDKGIKFHSVTSRVKTLASIAKKAKDKDLDDPMADMDDLVGARMVVLFLSDLPRLDSLVRESFNIESSDNKIESADPATFGYMSVHYVGTLGDEYSGPRYDRVKDLRFEIQTRTVVMDAWANVSHYLDYKGDSTIPEELRKDFHALSGLFYVADKHFELFADSSKLSQEKAEEELKSGSLDDVDINLDTMEAFLARKYPDREQSDRAAIADVINYVASRGYERLGELEKDLDKVSDEFLEHELQFPPSDAETGQFSTVGVVRVSLREFDLKAKPRRPQRAKAKRKKS
jgi:ppGpp synthetase/RelA/SpoT-type nucleotidyltranferase